MNICSNCGKSDKYEYVPCGDEWLLEVMKLKKVHIVNLLRNSIKEVQKLKCTLKELKK